MCENPGPIGPIEWDTLIEDKEINELLPVGHIVSVTVHNNDVISHVVEKDFFIERIRLYKKHRIGGFELGYVGMFLGYEVEKDV